jgi:hypothetical protein
MNVADLIHLLQQEDPRATVVLWDHTASGGVGVSKLGRGEVQPLQLGSFESMGLIWLEAWVEGTDRQAPFPGVVLGSQ